MVSPVAFKAVSTDIPVMALILALVAVYTMAAISSRDSSESAISDHDTFGVCIDCKF